MEWWNHAIIFRRTGNRSRAKFLYNLSICFPTLTLWHSVISKGFNKCYELSIGGEGADAEIWQVKFFFKTREISVKGSNELCNHNAGNFRGQFGRKGFVNKDLSRGISRCDSLSRPKDYTRQGLVHGDPRILSDFPLSQSRVPLKFWLTLNWVHQGQWDWVFWSFSRSLAWLASWVIRPWVVT